MKPYTPKQRAAMAVAFKAARKYQPKQHYLCFSLSKAGEVDPRVSAACEMAKAEVRRRIAPCFTVSQWLMRQGHATERQASRRALKGYRARWLASLVAEFSTP